MMNELRELLQPSWGAERWILEGWETLQPEEKEKISQRVNALFMHGLPLTMIHDKIFYLHVFSLLAQLEVLAIQIPLKFEKNMSTDAFEQQMHEQLLDEIFHGLVFTKIVYLLSEPYATPPAYNLQIENFCDFIRQQTCPKISVVLLNLVAEGWIEELFKSLHKHNIAPDVFAHILEDEHRHVSEADLYCAIGLPEHTTETLQKLQRLEELMISSIFMQSQYGLSLYTLLGAEAHHEFMQSLCGKHVSQLKKIDLKPSIKWHDFFHLYDLLGPRINQHITSTIPVEATPLRQMLMSHWDKPRHPTMTAECELDITCLNYFNTKNVNQTLTLLMLQTMSLAITQHPRLRSFITYQQIHMTQHAQMALVVQLPHCDEHLGTIVFENCHELSTIDLAKKIKHNMQLMHYCYQKRAELEIRYPELKATSKIQNHQHNVALMPTASMVTLSNLASFGHTHASSPLLGHEALKFTLLTPQRKMIWNHQTHGFEAQDRLPICISSDHRVIDGNIHASKILDGCFQQKFQDMQHEKHSAWSHPSARLFRQPLEALLQQDVFLTYQIVSVLQTMCFDAIPIDNFIATYVNKAPQPA